MIGGFLYMVFLGNVYCTAVYSTYIQSYYKVPSDKIYVQDLMPIILFVNMFFMPIGAYLVSRNWSPQLLIFIGACIAFPCFFLASIMDTFVGFAIFYILGFAVNQGIVYMIPVHHSWLWFPLNPGLVSGIILGGYGAAGLIFDNLFTHMINPDNLKVDPVTGFYPQSVDDRFISTWRYVVTMWLALAIAGFCMIFKGPIKKKRQLAG